MVYERTGAGVALALVGFSSQLEASHAAGVAADAADAASSFRERVLALLLSGRGEQATPGHVRQSSPFPQLDVLQRLGVNERIHDVPPHSLKRQERGAALGEYPQGAGEGSRARQREREENLRRG